MTKFCPYCGEELIDEARFCKSCGENLEDFQETFRQADTYTDFRPPAVENDHTLATVLGVICAILIPLFGLIFGIYLATRKDSEKAKKYGILIIALSVVIWFISFIIVLMSG